MSTLTPTDLKGDSETGVLPRIADYLYDRLTGGHDTVCESAIASAELWVSSVLSRAGIQADYDTPEVREAAILRTLYELYAFGENEAIARDKKKEALLSLQRKYGSTVNDDIADAGKSQPAEKPQGLPEIAVHQGKNHLHGF